jgi:hypothetical protein
MLHHHAYVPPVVIMVILILLVWRIGFGVTGMELVGAMPTCWCDCHTRFCEQNQVLIACVSLIIYSTHKDIKCSHIAKYHE